MLFHQPTLLSLVIWFCFVSSLEEEEDSSDSRQLTSDEIGILSTWTKEVHDDHGKSTVESDDRSLMSEIAENIQELHHKYFPHERYCCSVYHCYTALMLN